MNKTELLEMALEKLTAASNYIDTLGGVSKGYRIDIERLKAALEAKDEPVAHSVVAGALFDFMGWLTSREKRLILSSVDEAGPAVEAITEFAKKRNLSLKYAEVGYWMEFLSTPPQRTFVGLTDEEIRDLWSWSMTREAEFTATTQQHAFARAIEAKLKEKNT